MSLAKLRSLASSPQLLIAGNDSSASLMGNAIHRLANDPPLQEKLRAHPDRIPDFIEEMLRLEPPFHGHFREASKDAELAGVKIPKGSRIMLLWGSGNRDGRHFPEPEMLDLDRKNKRTHLAFGHGAHLCLGANLARLEARVTFEELFKRTGRIESAGESVGYMRSVFVRTPERVPVIFKPA